MPADDDCGDVRAKELKAALVGCRAEGGLGVKRAEVKELVHNKKTIHSKGKSQI